MQSNLLPNFAIYKDTKEGAAYTVPMGSEIDVYRKVNPCQTTGKDKAAHARCRKQWHAFNGVSCQHLRP